MGASPLSRERGRVRDSFVRRMQRTPHLNPLPLTEGRGGEIAYGLVRRGASLQDFQRCVFELKYRSGFSSSLLCYV
jgi:hypothetical protein